MMTNETQGYLTHSEMQSYDEVEEDERPVNSSRTGELTNAKTWSPALIGFTSEEISCNNLLGLLENELLSLKQEHFRLMLEESMTWSVFTDLKSHKLELDACIAEDFAARRQCDGLITALQGMLEELRDARKEEEIEMNLMTMDLKKHAEYASCSLSQIEVELGVVLQETEESKASEANILYQTRALSEKSISSKDRKPKLFTIPEEHFEYLIQRIYESETTTEMKVAAAKKQIKTVKDIEHEASKELNNRRKQIEEMQAILELASKRVEATEVAKKVLRQKQKREIKKSVTYPETLKRNLIVPQIKIKEQYIAREVLGHSGYK